MSGPILTPVLCAPKAPVLGSTLAGEIEAVGKDVTLFRKGDQVFGATADDLARIAEYVWLPEDGALAYQTGRLTHEEAVAIPMPLLTALPSFSETMDRFAPAKRMLINGASGSVGSYAVQLAKQVGAEVTGVCSTEKVEMCEIFGS